MSSINGNKMTDASLPATVNGDSVKMESHNVEQSAEPQPGRTAEEDVVASHLTLKLILLVTACVFCGGAYFYCNTGADNAQALSDCFLSSTRTISSGGACVNAYADRCPLQDNTILSTAIPRVTDEFSSLEDVGSVVRSTVSSDQS